MPISKIFLPDVDVWLALTSQRHIHAAICASWLNSIESDEVVFCRVTQMGVLRLLTHSAVMGTDVLSSREAWRAYRTILADERVQFAPSLSRSNKSGGRSRCKIGQLQKIWTDAYLFAFARSAGMQIVTLERAVLSLASEALLLT